ncbi:unnamed protein product [Cylicocyclus nassatus]|uniref:PNPLA domain-containing protein n=1 Tax=Cylicocyclus nassatus TaxID=53992 RepID=A0AA36HB53_CYLNA|nr:unnamed protein product [Cylicocyclus nassatus]
MPEDKERSSHCSTASSGSPSPSRSLAKTGLSKLHSYPLPQSLQNISGKSDESANNLTQQSLSTARSSISNHSLDSTPASQTRTSPDAVSPAWKTSIRKIVSVLNLVPKEKTAAEKRQEREQREKDMFLTRPAICQKPIKTISKFCISLSGCGFLGSYHFGAVSCFVKNGKYVLDRLDRASGASAGSLVASLLLLVPDKIEPATQVLYALGEELMKLNFGALTPGYYLNERLIKIVDDFLPDDISPAQGRLYISLTNRLERKNVLINKFKDKEHLLQCLMASCYIPMYSMGYGAQAPIIDGCEYIDGGYTNNLPDFEDMRTITISPFSGHAEISPIDEVHIFDWKMTVAHQIMNVNFQNIVRGAQALFPPSRAVLQAYYDLGYKDALRFLIKNEIVERPEGTEV